MSDSDAFKKGIQTLTRAVDGEKALQRLTSYYADNDIFITAAMAGGTTVGMKEAVQVLERAVAKHRNAIIATAIDIASEDVQAGLALVEKKEP